MNMSFKRNDIQEFVEYDNGCLEKEKWPSYKAKLNTWSVSEDNISKLQNCRESDIISYFFKAAQTFIQAIDEIKNKRFAWSIIKLYYSSFYLLRCDILRSNYIMVRCGSFFYGKIIIGQSLIPFRKNNVRGDHQFTISLAEKLYEDGDVNDPLLDNKIDDLTSYTWLMKNRERVNYQMKNFSDPYSDVLTAHFESYFKESKISELLKFYASNTDYSVCFDVDHAALSIPFKKLQSTFIYIKENLSLTDKEFRKMVDLKWTLENLGINTDEIEQMIK
jgi:hypothetical protein